LVNIVDRMNITAQGRDAPATMPSSSFPFHLVLVLKAGRARGRYDLTVKPEGPQGEAGPARTISLNFEGEDDRGVQLIQRSLIELMQEGLYWFNIYLAGELLTRLPLRVVYTRITGGPVPAP
jgi:hypothetical protein